MPSSRMMLVIRFQYFLYFGVMGVYLPYFNLYCHHIGFSGFQIGLLSALRSVLLVLFPIAWGMLADRFEARRAIYIGCSIASAGIWVFYLFTTDFWVMVGITTAYGIFYSPLISFLEAFTMDLLGGAKGRYGITRAWGSVAFIVVVIGVGRLIDAVDVSVILLVVLAGSLAMAVMSMGMPPVAHKRESTVQYGGTARLMSMRTVVFLACAFLMLFSHGAYYGFFSIHLAELGFGKTFIGVSWALASTAEICVMVASERIFDRYALRSVLFVSFLAAAVRWYLLSFVTSGPAILLLQLLHAVTYGTFHMASILYIDALSPEKSKTMGQAVNNAVTYGLGLMAGFFVSGILYEQAGPQVLFAASAGMALAGGVILGGYHMIEDRCR